MLKRLSVLSIMFAVSTAALAAGDKCGNVPKDQWQPIAALEKKLTAEGWKIKRAKIDSGCYEVYGTNGKGERAEVYFHPKTLEPLKG